MRALIIIVLALTLTSCSSQFAYRNLDWLVHWYVDDYVDLNDEQTQVFDGYMADWLTWHQSQELLSYNQHLLEIAEQVNGGQVTQQQWLMHFERGYNHWVRFRERIAPGLLDIAQQLDRNQIEALFAELDEQNKENQQEYEEYKDEQLERRIKRLEKQLKRWIGKPSKKQLALINAYAETIESSFPFWIDYRIKWQQALKKTLLAKDSAEFKTKMLTMLRQPELWQSKQYQQIRQKNREELALLLEQLTPTLTKKQLKKLNRKIDGFSEDLTELAKN